MTENINVNISARKMDDLAYAIPLLRPFKIELKDGDRPELASQIAELNQRVADFNAALEKYRKS